MTAAQTEAIEIRREAFLRRVEDRTRACRCWWHPEIIDGDIYGTFTVDGRPIIRGVLIAKGRME